MTNSECMKQVIDYIETHLDAELTLSNIADHVSYSPYHLHHMFTGLFQMSIHTYIMRRRLSVAATMLCEGKQDMLQIALCCGYHSQQAFSDAFQKLYHKRPASYRRKGKPYCIQHKLTCFEKPVQTDRFQLSYKTMDEIYLLGYGADTEKGFHVIGRCHRQLKRHITEIKNRKDAHRYMGINDYTRADMDSDTPAFSYFAGVEVTEKPADLQGMQLKVLPASRYICLTFYADPKASMEEVASYMYHECLPETTCVFNDEVMMDVVMYSDDRNASGEHRIDFMSAIQ